MRKLSVQGKGHVVAEPDMVTVSFGVEVSAYDYEECLRTLNMKVEDLRQGITSSGLEKSQLKTRDFNVGVKSKLKNKEYVFGGYSASHRLHIELPMEKELLNRILRHVASGLSGARVNLSFSIRDKESLRKKALALAVQNAREKAEMLATAAGVKLGKLLQIDYGWSEVHIYDSSANMDCPDMAESKFDVDIEPEDVSAGDSVTLVYEID